MYRVQRLVTSIQKYNKERIPFYLSVPEQDIPLFAAAINLPSPYLITDESIITANSLHRVEKFKEYDGRLTQQVIKADFWRLGYCENYLCLDSDCEFIRDFYYRDFINNGIPYTVITESKSHLEFCDRYYLSKVRENFNQISESIKLAFERQGKNYDFGPMPLVWSAKVWKSLSDHLWKNNQQSLLDFILIHPSEITLYGESLLKYEAIKLIPCEPFFKVYHYESQYYYDNKRKVTNDLIAKNYLGIIKQSNWENLNFDKSNKGFFSKLIKVIKTKIRYQTV